MKSRLIIFSLGAEKKISDTRKRIRRRRDSRIKKETREKERQNRPSNLKV